MTKVDLIAKVAAEAELTKKDAEKAVAAVLDGITEALKAGDKVALVGFGTFETRERPARKGRNPRTKEEITIPATTAPAFKAGKALKDAVRIDKFMKVSRLIKRRTVANEVADAGRITVNGKPVKASYAVKEGDVIEVAFGQRPVRVKVVSTEAPTGKDLAREMYVVLSE